MHVVDGSGEQPEYEYEAVRLELELFSPALVDKPYIVVYNKMDLPEASDRWNSFREKLQAQGFEPYCTSALNRQGTQDVVYAAYKILQKERQRVKEVEGALHLIFAVCQITVVASSLGFHFRCFS